MKKIFLLILFSTILSGCSARLVSADAKEVVITNVIKSTSGDATRIAEIECAKYGKQAFHLSNDGDTATYRCVNY